MKSEYRWARLAAVAVLMVLLLPASPVQGQSSGPRGPAFEDPAAPTQEMDQVWRDRPVVYEAGHADADLVVTLNQQFFEFMTPYIEDYGREHHLKIVVNKGTCGISSGFLAKKQVDIGAFCCPPTRSDRLPGLKFHTLGIHPISILVHPDNQVADLTLEQIRAIFQGDIHRWSEMGWKDQAIQVVTRLHCKNRPGHWRLLLDNSDLFSPEARSVGAIEDMFSLVATTPNAIGWEVMWMTDAYRRDGKVKSLRIDGMDPKDTRNLLAGRYPLYRVLSITTWEDDKSGKPHARRLAAYIAAQVEKYGLDQGIVPASQLRQAGWRFADDELIGEQPVIGDR